MISSDSDVRPSTQSMRKSVENLVISSQDAIGQSISHALSFSGAITQQVTQHINQEYRSVSRSPSPCRRSAEPPILEYEDCTSADNVDAATSEPQSLDANVPARPHSSSGSGDGQRAPQTPKPAEGRSKKKSWYSSLYPTYKSRSEDFKRIFKDVPDDERLIVDYSCALQKDILVHGRLYVSQNYLCFYANIFRWETTLTLRLKDVTAITKEKTALVIPNAILVCTDAEKHFLTSFSGRDKAYLMLFRVWQNALMDQPISSQEVWQWVHSCYGEELGFNSDDEEYPKDNEDDKLSNNMRLSIESISEDFLDSSVDCAVDESGIAIETLNSIPSADVHSLTSAPINVTSNYSRHSSPGHRSSPPRVASSAPSVWGRTVKTDAVTNGYNGVESLPTDMSDTTESDEEKIISVVASASAPNVPTALSSPQCTNSHEGRTIIDADIGLRIDQLFTMLFTNSNFFIDFHNQRKTTDLEQGPWKENPAKGRKCRVLNFTMSLSNSVGPKTAQVTETQEILSCSRPGHLYALDVDTVNGGIPYADTFSVKVHYCLKKKADQVTNLQVIANINYKKSVWGIVKSFIEKNCWAGLEDFFNCLLKALHSEVEEERGPNKRKGRRRRRPNGEGSESTASVGKVSDAALSTSISSAKPSVSPNVRPSSMRWAPRIGLYILCATLLALLLLNAALYARLWALDNEKLTIPWGRTPAISPPSPEQIAQWSHILKKQSSYHLGELEKWRYSLNEAISLLRQTETALADLQEAIKPTLEKSHTTANPEL